MEIRDRIKEFRRVRAGDLIPNKKNWRRHPKAQAEALKEILAQVGFADAVLARETPEGLVLIDGHLRREEVDPDQELPTLVLGVTEAEADKLLLTLDPLAGMATTDAATLAALMDSVRLPEGALTGMLADIAGQGKPPLVVADPPAQIDKAGELKAKWGTEAGQTWQIGRHRLLCGDSRDIAAVGRLWPEGSPRIRMTWTDPPYGVDYAAKNAYLNRTDRGNRIQVPIENDNLTAGETGIAFKKALEVAKQFAEPGAACYATVPAGPMLIYFVQAFTAAGFTYRAQLVWLKQQFVLGMADYHHRFEPILYGWLPDAAHFFVDDRSQDDVFQVDRPHVSDLHPTTKPVELIARMIANSSRSGELVYDPFCGSGSTLLAAHQLGRVGYGVEIDPGYAAVTLERMLALGIDRNDIRLENDHAARTTASTNKPKTTRRQSRPASPQPG